MRLKVSPLPPVAATTIEYEFAVLVIVSPPSVAGMVGSMALAVVVGVILYSAGVWS